MHSQTCICAPWFDSVRDLGSPLIGQDPKQALPKLNITSHLSSKFSHKAFSFTCRSDQPSHCALLLCHDHGPSQLMAYI